MGGFSAGWGISGRSRGTLGGPLRSCDGQRCWGSRWKLQVSNTDCQDKQGCALITSSFSWNNKAHVTCPLQWVGSALRITDPQGFRLMEAPWDAGIPTCGSKATSGRRRDRSLNPGSEMLPPPSRKQYSPPLIPSIHVSLAKASLTALMWTSWDMPFSWGWGRGGLDAVESQPCPSHATHTNLGQSYPKLCTDQLFISKYIFGNTVDPWTPWVWIVGFTYTWIIFYNKCYGSTRS